jgi:hypothetical protein
MVRNENMGHWCGYAGVKPEHPFFGKTYQDLHLYAPGGLTYTNSCNDRVCHKPAPGEPDNIWWLGFDCAHGGDQMPKSLLLNELLVGLGRPILDEYCLASREEHYWTFEEVKEAVKHLAEQVWTINQKAS